MPQVVYLKPDALSGALGAVTGTLQGQAAAEGEKRKRLTEDRAFGEQQLQYRVDTANQNAHIQEAFGEEQRQFDVNERFRRSVQETNRREGVYNRQLQGIMQEKDITDKQFQQKRALDESNLENARDNATRRFDIKKRSEAQADERAMARAQTLMSQKQDLEFAQRVRGEMGDPNTTPYTKAQWDAIYQQAYDRYLGPGTTTGQQDVPQATEEQKAAIRKQVEGSILGYDQARAKLTSDTAQEAEALSSIEAKYRAPTAASAKLAKGIGTEGGFKMDEIFHPDAAVVDPLSGQREFSPEFWDSLSASQKTAINNIDNRLSQMAARLPGHDAATAYQIEDEMEQEIKDSFDGEEWKGAHPSSVDLLEKTYKTRAALILDNLMNATPVTPDTGE